MTRTNSIGSRANSLNTLANKRTTPPRNDTYTVRSGSGSGGADIVKNIEEVVARNKMLEEENGVLRGLIHEESGQGSLAGFDERRTLMLKCQIYQLEKQVSERLTLILTLGDRD